MNYPNALDLYLGTTDRYKNLFESLAENRAALGSFLRGVGIIDNTSDEITHYEQSANWIERDFTTVNSFIDKYREYDAVRDIDGTETTLEIIKIIVDDINSYYDWRRIWDMVPNVSTPEKLIFELVSIQFFFTQENKDIIHRFSQQEIEELLGEVAYFKTRNFSLSEEERDKHFSVLKRLILDIISKYDSLPLKVKETVPISKKTQLISEANNAAYRVAATQINRGTAKVVASVLPGGGKDFVNSELGRSFISFVSGMALTQVAGQGGKIERVARELRIGGITGAGNFVAEEVVGMLNGILTDALVEIPLSEDILIEETMEEKLMIEKGK